ncbi:hypothetical protein [Nostoc sp.]
MLSQKEVVVKKIEISDSLNPQTFSQRGMALRKDTALTLTG